MRVLVVTKLFPNAAQPLLAPFNRQQIAALAGLADVRVLATIPYFPGATRAGPIPMQETIEGVPVWHPRTLYIPKLGLPVAPALYMASLVPYLRSHFLWADVVLACWAYPDGAAAIGLGALTQRPVVVKVHGTDINDVAQRPQVRPILKRVLPRAHKVIAVSQGLARAVQALGVAGEKVALVPNGINRACFYPRPQAPARASLGVPNHARLVLFVGALVKTKGVEDLLAAFASAAVHQPDLQLAMVGTGALRARCEQMAEAFPGRVFVTGALPAAQVAQWMAACDLLTLPSYNEGTPNVVLEALASGRPVVATRVGGIPDVLTDDALGQLVPKQDPVALAEAWHRVFKGGSGTPQHISAAAPGDWHASAKHLHDVLMSVRA